MDTASNVAVLCSRSVVVARAPFMHLVVVDQMVSVTSTRKDTGWWDLFKLNFQSELTS